MKKKKRVMEDMVEGYTQKGHDNCGSACLHR